MCVKVLNALCPGSLPQGSLQLFLPSSLSAQCTEHLPLCLLLHTGKDGCVSLRGPYLASSGLSCGPPYRTIWVQSYGSCPVFIFCLLHPRLSQELLEAKEQKASEDSLDDLYWALPVQGDLSDYHQPYSSASSSLENQLMCPAVDVASSTQATCPQGTWSGDLSPRLSKLQASQTQLDPSTLVPSFPQELVLAPSIAMKNPLQMEDDPLEGSSNIQWHQVPGNIDASSVPKPKNIKRKFPFSKWICWPLRSGCRAPSVGMKNAPQLEDDALEGSADTTQGRQVTGNIHASSVSKPKNIKRILPFTLGAVAHTSKPSTLGGRGGQITRSRDQDHPGQHGKTLSLLEKAKIIPALWHSSVVPANWDAETEESLRTQKAEVAVSQDHATVLQPARKSETPTQEKKIKRKLTFSNWICWPSCSGCRAAVTSVWCPVSHGLPFCQALSVPISSLLDIGSSRPA
ncbi:uncharacterized protein LOC108592765 isoform X2 [Callithrix jacchus]